MLKQIILNFLVFFKSSLTSFQTGKYLAMVDTLLLIHLLSAYKATQ